MQSISCATWRKSGSSSSNFQTSIAVAKSFFETSLINCCWDSISLYKVFSHQYQQKQYIIIIKQYIILNILEITQLRIYQRKIRIFHTKNYMETVSKLFFVYKQWSSETTRVVNVSCHCFKLEPVLHWKFSDGIKCVFFYFRNASETHKITYSMNTFRNSQNVWFCELISRQVYMFYIFKTNLHKRTFLYLNLSNFKNWPSLANIKSIWTAKISIVLNKLTLWNWKS